MSHELLGMRSMILLCSIRFPAVSVEKASYIIKKNRGNSIIRFTSAPKVAAQSMCKKSVFFKRNFLLERLQLGKYRETLEKLMMLCTYISRVRFAVLQNKLHIFGAATIQSATTLVQAPRCINF